MAGTKDAAKFGSETHDNCEDDARTKQNRAPGVVDDGGMDNAHQRAREKESDQPPKREASE
jgi:hypothetical protein